MRYHRVIWHATAALTIHKRRKALVSRTHDAFDRLRKRDNPPEWLLLRRVVLGLAVRPPRLMR
jgi:hypothetical protein